ncbi:hypothetical protein BBBOND_0102450 [Babesia bigemina]|uniref:Uncharacterized protein n=1 Tax=Babesia bigemina TaxID=5866 RepID=A0A061CZ65_BABBI|nr:hypothetical protein BBBOND_0102450 [Babesia bigemina]CDR93916.1 hypothetical protein BBBOND_0102450 [Babesia bigemina]|eukprot:XP_012766102.1 hypothetical protein BBBOND_0102450 [Babesia bigemina]
MVYNSLTEAPRNLKEGIDWLIALRGTDAKKNIIALGSAVYDLLADAPVGNMKLPTLEEVKLITKEFLEKPEIKGRWFASRLLQKFNEPRRTPNLHFKRLFNKYKSDYHNVVQKKELQRKDMGLYLGRVVYGCDTLVKHMKVPDQYESAYSSEASWDASCSRHPAACAVVFVGIAPMLYAGLYSLKYVTSIALTNESNNTVRERLAELLSAVGYDESYRRPRMKISYIFEALKDVDKDVLDILYDFSGFWAFYGLESSVSEGETSEETTVRTKTRKFYMGQMIKHGIPGVDVDMGLLHAWNTKHNNKPSKIHNALGSGNMYYPGTPTVSDLGAAIPL